MQAALKWGIRSEGSCQSTASFLALHLLHLRKQLVELTAESAVAVNAVRAGLFVTLYEELCALDERIEAMEKCIQQAFQRDKACQRIAQMKGAGPVIATAIVAAIADGKTFRMLLIHGARPVVYRCVAKTDSRSRWIGDKQKRLGTTKACVAVANKNARIIWALFAKG
jgi:transposase